MLKEATRAERLDVSYENDNFERKTSVRDFAKERYAVGVKTVGKHHTACRVVEVCT